MAREFKYRGLSFDELKKAPESKLMQVLNARGRRTLKRGVKLDKRILRGISDQAKGKIFDKPVKTHNRDILIMPNMIGIKFAVYTGKTFGQVIILDDMVGHYLGEFVDTRMRPKHSKAGIGATKSSKHVGKK